MSTTHRYSILVVDDELSIRESFDLVLQDSYKIFIAASGEAALKRIVDSKIDLVFLDIRMPGIDGIETLKRIKEIDESVEVVMVTAINDVQKAGEAIKLGANNYIVKPFDVEQIQAMAKSLAGKKQLKMQTKNMRDDAKQKASPPELSGYSKSARKARDIISELSQDDSTVVISGENGTEKYCAAAQIHALSPRKLFPFKIFNASELMNEKTVMAKLFGEEKGSFTYALEKGIGLAEEASGGTLFINNIEKTPVAIQKLISSMINSKEICRLGGTIKVPVDTRVILGTSEDKKELIELDMTDMSLLVLEPLRLRMEDVLAISAALIESFNERHGKNIREIGPDAKKIMMNYDWPGNTVELKNIIEKAVLCCDSDIIKTKDLPMYVLIKTPGFFSLDESKEFASEEMSTRFEKQFIPHILKRADYDLARASQILGMNRHILSSKIDTLGIQLPA